MTTNNQWLDFLKQHNAHFENNLIAHFGNRDAEQQAAVTSNVLCELTHLGFIAASGEEAQEFLQNQLSNDIKQVSEHHSQLNAHCTAKGRALALFRVFQYHDRYYLQLPAEQIEAMLKRLRMFVLRSKVTLQDDTQMIAFGLAGPNASEIVASLGTDAPQQDNQCVTTGKLSVCKIPGTQDRYIILGETQNAIEAWTQLQPQTVACSHHAWRYLDILAGIPQIYPANTEAFVPQMINLHSIDGVSFKKGCYPGQEVVARMHYLGKLKRRMYLAHVDIDQQPQVGGMVFAKNDQSKEGIGKIVDAEPNPGGGFDLLTVLQIASAEAGPTHLNSPEGPELKIQDLPYEVVLEREDK